MKFGKSLKVNFCLKPLINSLHLGLVDSGFTKSIGVSNCNSQLYIDICAGARIRPVMNQIEIHPHLNQEKLVSFLRKFGCEFTAYAPLGAASFSGNNVLEDETLKEIAEKYNATPAQIALAWNMSRGIVVIPKSTKVERMKANFNALDIQLEQEDIERINALNKDARFNDPGNWDQHSWHYSPIFS